MDRQPLPPDAVYSISLMDLYLVYQFVEHPRRELSRPRVLANCRDEHIRGRGFAVDSLDVGLKRLDRAAKFGLFRLVLLGHTDETFVANLTGNVVLVEFLEQRVQLSVAGFDLAQLKLCLFTFSCHRLLGEAHHQLCKLRLILAHELCKAANFSQDNFFEEIYTDIVSAGTSAALALGVGA